MQKVSTRGNAEEDAKGVNKRECRRGCKRCQQEGMQKRMQKVSTRGNAEEDAKWGYEMVIRNGHKKVIQKGNMKRDTKNWISGIVNDGR